MLAVIILHTEKVKTFPLELGKMTKMPTLTILKKYIYFLMWTIFKIFIEFVIVLLLFTFSFFGVLVMWNLSLATRGQPVPSAMGGKVLITGLLGKSLTIVVQYSTGRSNLSNQARKINKIHPRSKEEVTVTICR